ncbi:hypothetical protein BGW38_002895, partial [Lunasporangiospora selenospora]
MSRHLCGLVRINVAQIRAICGECSNDYKDLYCTFGCGSRRWRLDIMIDFVASDGSAEMQCKIEGNRAQDSLWALLGLAKIWRSISTTLTKDRQRPTFASQLSVSGSKSKSDLAETNVSKVLRILARRGELSFHRTDPWSGQLATPREFGIKTKAKTSDIEALEMSDSSERSQLEQRLWTDICNAAAPCTAAFVGLSANTDMLVLTIDRAITPNYSSSNGIHPESQSPSRATSKDLTQLQQIQIRVGGRLTKTFCPPPK